MGVNLHGRSLLTLLDYSTLEINYLLSLSHELKKQKQISNTQCLLHGKNIVLVFNKPSTRTRCAFEVAITDECGQVTYLADSHLGYKESLEDTAKVLGRYFDGIAYRGDSQLDAELLASFAGIPVWNALTDQYHPTQALADIMTIQEHIEKPLYQIKLVYIGDGGNNVAHSLIVIAAKLGMQLTILGPESLRPNAGFINNIIAITQTTKAVIQFSTDVDNAINGADFIYTDVWVSMSETTEWQTRIELLKSYQVNQAMIDKTRNSHVKFMHCLPALHDEETSLAKTLAEELGLHELEVTDQVFRSKHSIVFEQAENRLHTIKAVVLATIGNI
ncbi:MAG: ornithine carbamoyltransferase [Gammaproteobacteria bacterium]